MNRFHIMWNKKQQHSRVPALIAWDRSESIARRLTMTWTSGFYRTTLETSLLAKLSSKPVNREGYAYYHTFIISTGPLTTLTHPPPPHPSLQRLPTEIHVRVTWWWTAFTILNTGPIMSDYNFIYKTLWRLARLTLKSSFSRSRKISLDDLMSRPVYLLRKNDACHFYSTLDGHTKPRATSTKDYIYILGV